MRAKSNIVTAAAVLFLSLTGMGRAEADGFQPDPRAVVGYGPAYRYPQAGWIVIHIEGEPYERGVQHGRLLSSEIAAHIRCFAAMYSSQAPQDAWKLLRIITQSMFLGRFDREYLEEMRGIADGAAAMGAKFDDRPLDLTDIATLNLWPEIMCLEWGAGALPTGLEGVRFANPDRKQALPVKPGHCSAFAATGPATADGKIVFGHITMFSLYPSTFYNIWLDVKPAKGHRIVMQSFPGGIHSAMDYYINDAGILVSETTIDQTRFDVSGAPLASRIRKALQYSDSIDEVVAILKKDNNGLYTNEWLLADTKTNEIAMFELGTHTSRLYRSNNGDWFGGTEGFYWGCNNAKDLDVRLETIASVNDRPENMVWRPSDRDVKWVELYQKHKGKIGVGFGKEAFTTSPICAAASVDAKFATTDMARQLQTWAIFGPPRGKIWEPSDEEKEKYPEIEPLVPNPWTILNGDAPPPFAPESVACDLQEKAEESRSGENKDEEEEWKEPALPQAVVWRGTILPKSDADIWLASAFAEYHTIVERERGMREVAKKECLCSTDLDKLSIGLYRARSRFLAAAAGGDVSITSITSQFASNNWYKIASGKGVLVLSELRRRIGDERFVEGMDAFGFENAGKSVAWADFAGHMAKTAGTNLDDFFAYWVKGTGLPKLRLTNVTVKKASESTEEQFVVEGVLSAANGLLPPNIVVTIETADDEITKVVEIDAHSGAFRTQTDVAPRQLIVDKYGQVAKANGGNFSIGSWMSEQHKTVIVYGTRDDEVANRAASELVQKQIRDHSYNFVIPIKSDVEMTDGEIADSHLILIGRPTTNRLTERLQGSLPVSFDRQSFVVRGKTYGHYRSAVIAAGANPQNPRVCIVAIAGLSALSTYLAADGFLKANLGAEVLLMQHGEKPAALVIPAPELTKDLSTSRTLSAGSAN